MSKVRKVKDPARLGRACYQYGYEGRVYCGASALAHAQKTAPKPDKPKNGR